MMMKMNKCLKRMVKKRTSSHHNKTSSHNNMVFPIFSLDMKANTMRTLKALRSTTKGSILKFGKSKRSLLRKSKRSEGAN
ncbi:hypothetical protein PIB30_113300 [Stylosanthes scabra]|uniref:Uncharacterized protein n=1 Tax=Stylosanthes scabra TaxID=79078 RepID=A0ABU6ZZS9_9FABA|nr:hypothetical protein [Stylosanthes scabra]